MIHTTRVFCFRYPEGSAQDDIRVVVLMIIVNMREATFLVAITVGVILDAHNVFSHLRPVPALFPRYPKLAARQSTQAVYKFMPSLMYRTQT